MCVATGSLQRDEYSSYTRESFIWCLEDEIFRSLAYIKVAYQDIKYSVVSKRCASKAYLGQSTKVLSEKM